MSLIKTYLLLLPILFYKELPYTTYHTGLFCLYYLAIVFCVNLRLATLNSLLLTTQGTCCRSFRSGAVHRIRTCKSFQTNCFQGSSLTTRTDGILNWWEERVPNPLGSLDTRFTVSPRSLRVYLPIWKWFYPLLFSYCNT